MKKTRLVVYFLTVLTFLLHSCKLYNENSSTGLSNKYNGDKPKTTITYEKAGELQKEYIRTRAEFLNEFLNNNGTIEGEDTRDVWYDLETIKQYISYVEKQAKKKGYKNLGLRVYFGAYPKNSNYKDAGYSTMFFIPTYKPNKTSMSFKSQDSDENTNMTDVEGLNFGGMGRPPKDLH